MREKTPVPGGVASARMGDSRCAAWSGRGHSRRACLGEGWSAGTGNKGAGAARAGTEVLVLRRASRNGTGMLAPHAPGQGLGQHSAGRRAARAAPADSMWGLHCGCQVDLCTQEVQGRVSPRAHRRGLIPCAGAKGLVWPAAWGPACARKASSCHGSVGRKWGASRGRCQGRARGHAQERVRLRGLSRKRGFRAERLARAAGDPGEGEG